MKQFICNMPLKHKIQVIVLLCIALLSTAALTGLHFVTTAYDNVLYKTAASALSSSALKVQNNLNNLNSMADLFLSDNNIQNYLGIIPKIPRKRTWRTATSTTPSVSIAQTSAKTISAT